MKLADITTIQEVSLEYGIPVTTLKTRLDSKSINMIEGKDFKRMGKGQGVLLSPKGVEKIIKEDSKLQVTKTCRINNKNDLTYDVKFDKLKIERFIEGLEVSLIFKFFLNDELVSTVYYDFAKHTNYSIKHLSTKKDDANIDIKFELLLDDSIII